MTLKEQRSWSALVVVFDPLRFSKDSFLRLAHKMDDGSYCFTFGVPKAQKLPILRKIKELAPRSVSIEELAQYEIA